MAKQLNAWFAGVSLKDSLPIMPQAADAPGLYQVDVLLAVEQSCLNLGYQRLLVIAHNTNQAILPPGTIDVWLRPFWEEGHIGSQAAGLYVKSYQPFCKTWVCITRPMLGKSLMTGSINTCNYT